MNPHIPRRAAAIGFSLYELAVLAELPPERVELAEANQAELPGWMGARLAAALTAAQRWQRRDERRRREALAPPARKEAVVQHARRFALAVQAARVDLGLSLEEMAHELGLRLPALLDLERGRVRLTEAEVLEVCAYLGVKVPGFRREEKAA